MASLRGLQVDPRTVACPQTSPAKKPLASAFRCAIITTVEQTPAARQAALGERGTVTQAAGPRGLVLISTDIEDGYEDQVNAWYDEEHVPERRNCPGFISGRRFVVVEGHPKYLTFYELTSLEVLESEAYKRLTVPNERTLAMRPHLKNHQRNVYREIS